MEYKTPETVKEKKEVRELLKELMDFHAEIDNFYKTPDTFEIGDVVICVKEDDIMIGVITGAFRKNIPDRNKNYAYISSIYVSPQYRRRGIAEELFTRFKILAKDHGLERLEVSADIRNESSMAFWEKMRFKTYQYRMFLEF